VTAPFAALLLTVAAAGGAARPFAPAPVCPIVPVDAAPALDVAASRNRAPLAFYPLGFSKTGRFAWLERRVGFDSDETTWLLRIVDLASDRILAEPEYALKSGTLAGMCGRYGRTIARLLAKHGIERTSPLTLEQPEAGRDPTAVKFTAGRPDPERHRTSYRVTLQGREGTKQLGVLFRVGVESGEPPLSAPTLLGIMRSPWEPRIAVLCRQTMTGTEGAAITVITVMGGRLDRGWHPAN
jgi:hypothetical protein